VFGSAGRNDAIPWAIADASPLAGEPLAAVFLRLLALPVSRFGLEEMLDLLASPPLAEAAGLDGAAFERLHGWLHDAGARWGLDAAHRARFDAPHDDAYTWAFALDRLLLGHASGDEGDIAGVAPWPDLEGGALDALDALIRLLRVLARHERAFANAMTPSPRTPRAPATPRRCPAKSCARTSPPCWAKPTRARRCSPAASASRGWCRCGCCRSA
jgi:exodeoxyribonuclease V gamma subunit